MQNTPEEKMNILKMVEENQINAEEAARRLEALGKGEKLPASGSSVVTADRPRFLRVHVTNMATGKSKVNVTVPYTLVSWGLRLGAQYAPELATMDLSTLDQALAASAGTKIVDVMDDEDGEHVEIYID